MILCNAENNIRDLKDILSSIVLSQQCCEVYLISLVVAKETWLANMTETASINLTGSIRPWMANIACLIYDAG